MSTSIDPKEIAVLTTEVRHLTQAVTKLLHDVDGHRADVQELTMATRILEEKQNNTKERMDTAIAELSKFETKLIRLEMETWKLGLMLGGSATGGGVIAVIVQYLIKVFST